VRLGGKRALVTGAAHGIGRAAAARLAGEGARVALLDVDRDALAQAAAAAGREALVLPADVADERAVAATVAAATQVWGGLDVVVANAAIQLAGGDDRADRLEPEAWRRTLEVNLTGAFHTLKHGVRALLAAGGDSVVCTASPAGLYGIARGLHAYSASKAGMAGLIRVAAADYAAQGIRVNGVLPGITATPMNPLVDARSRGASGCGRRHPARPGGSARGDRRRDRVPGLRRRLLRHRRPVDGGRRADRRLIRDAL
jgi:NAD(P)-dependent dehydrogenase (short-subunit alcohol dehydrogenase family)